MPHSQKRVAPRQRATLPQITTSLDSCTSTDTAADLLRQEPVDIIGLLAARSRVSPASIRAQFDAWQIGVHA